MKLFAFATNILAKPDGDLKDMAYENWQQVKEIFADALRQPPEMRPEFLDSACSDDNQLRREVESLLASFDSAESFMESPAVGDYANNKVFTETRKFSKGETLGHYEIIALLGKGGMGDVYLAQDSKLDRPVALKILRENISPENQAKQRLLREARAVAKLNHPSICAIYEISESDDVSFIVMQYAAGETLADILTKERLSAERSCNLALQIAEALEEAHAHHIIHRDIKPANIVVNNKGQLKVLDFGLAKFIEAEADGKTTQGASSSGAIMGTVPYMSPEQLRGESLDASTDIFSFGTVFYEMLSGISPFQHDSNAESISAILNDEPDLKLIPFELKTIVQKCLTKDKTARYQTAKDFAEDLRKVGAISATIGNTSKKPRYYFWKSSDSAAEFNPETKRITTAKNTKAEKQKLTYSAVLPISLVLFTLIGAAILFVWQFPEKSDSHNFDKLHSAKLVSWKAGASSPFNDYRVSHDGKLIAYSSTQEGENEGIYIKQTSDGEDFRVTKDSWSNQSPIWSPDDRRIAFASFREGQSGIYVCPSLGGQISLLKIVGEGTTFLRHWSKDGSKIFYETGNELFQLDIATLETSQITNLGNSRIFTRYFNFSPNENEIVYLDRTNGQEDLWTMPLNGGVPTHLTNDKDFEIQPRWHPDGKRILYTVLRNNHYQLNLANADGSNHEQITRGESEFELIDISGDGTKIFYRSWEYKSDIWGVNVGNGEEFEVAGGIEYEFWAEISPDGNSILYQSNAMSYPMIFMSESSIIIKSLNDQLPQISLKGINPRWLPDSRRIAFIRFEKITGKYSFWTYNTITGEEIQITEKPITNPQTAILPFNRGQIGESGWSPDGRQVIFLSKEGQIFNILKADLETSETANITNNDNPNLTFYSPKRSPDGNSITYISFQKPQSKDDKPQWGVWIVNDGKTKEIYSTSASLRLLGWSGKDKLLLEMNDDAITSSSLNIKLIEVSTNGGNRIISIFERIYATSMTLSADGKNVAFTSRQEGKDNIVTASTNGGELKKITANVNAKLYYGSPAWSPDGKTIFFDKQEEINTISIFENFK
jgi:serine/threonine protein kinase